MQSEARSKRLEAVSTHPLAELLACPPSTSSVLTASALSIGFNTGEVIFSQSGPCKGLYLVVSGQLQRRTERLAMRLSLGTARSGDLVELAAALGDRVHTYTLIAQTPGSVLLLPIDALHQAFHSFPPLRMRLLEELAREVSRAYHLCSLTNLTRIRRRGPSASHADG
jgi:CRP-like cAMP-binding protein